MPFSRSLQVRAWQPWQEKDEQTEGVPHEYSIGYLFWQFLHLGKFYCFLLFANIPNYLITMCLWQRKGRNELKGLEKWIFAPPGALLTPVTHSSGLLTQRPSVLWLENINCPWKWETHHHGSWLLFPFKGLQLRCQGSRIFHCLTDAEW